MYLWVVQGLQSGNQMYDLGKIHCVASLQLKWCKVVHGVIHLCKGKAQISWSCEWQPILLQMKLGRKGPEFPLTSSQ